MGPNENDFQIRRHQDTSNNSSISQITFEIIRKSNISDMFEKTGAENPEDLSNEIMYLLNLGPISSIKHDLEIW